MHTERLLAFYLFFDKDKHCMDYERIKKAVKFISHLDMCEKCEQLWGNIVSNLKGLDGEEIECISNKRKYKALVGSFEQSKYDKESNQRNGKQFNLLKIRLSSNKDKGLNFKAIDSKKMIDGTKPKPTHKKSVLDYFKKIKK